ncbi:MAG: acyltransferase [Bacteroidales bacterium]|nr:acyltransferase [Bacteroidales bacterium]
MKSLEARILNVRNEQDFRSLALEVFRFQVSGNPVYAAFLRHLGIFPDTVKETGQIPFLPIEMFKTHKVITGKKEPALVFESSGTTGQITSKHHVVSASLYQESFTRWFSANYGKPEERCILALLPAYLERENSSLIYMMKHLIGLSNHPQSGFYLDNHKGLAEVLEERNRDQHPTLLLGVSFALLDMAEKYPLPLSGAVTVMETGGMKGRRKEMVREELHEILKKAFSKKNIHSEYGMTELLSQGYSSGSGRFIAPPWMKVSTRDLYDPLSPLPTGRSGGINVIDLANLYSCSFIATGDTGRVADDGSFEITGRFDQSEIRGCNLMVL